MDLRHHKSAAVSAVTLCAASRGSSSSIRSVLVSWWAACRHPFLALRRRKVGVCTRQQHALPCSQQNKIIHTTLLARPAFVSRVGLNRFSCRRQRLPFSSPPPLCPKHSQFIQHIMIMMRRWRVTCMLACMLVATAAANVAVDEHSAASHDGALHGSPEVVAVWQQCGGLSCPFREGCVDGPWPSAK